MILKKNDFIVSCSALPGEPLHGPETMLKMCQAVIQGGAQALRLTSVEDIELIKKHVDVPIIGLIIDPSDDYEVFNTPSFEHVKRLHDAGADIVALDACSGTRPNGETLESIIKQAKEANIPLMADVDTYDNGILADQLGVDYITTARSGYSDATRELLTHEPNYVLMAKLVKHISTPLIAMGRIWTTEQAIHALELGVHSVVIGSAITKPRMVAKTFHDAIENFQAVQEYKQRNRDELAKY